MKEIKECEGKQEKAGRSRRESEFDIAEVLDHLDRHIMEPETGLSVAEQFYMSQPYFARRFKMATGLTWHDYRNRRRISLAFEPLVMSRTSIDEIAKQCGFANRRSFTAAFTRQCGVTPSTFRRRAAASGGLSVDGEFIRLGRFRAPHK